ncbi:hypothetical protein DFJ73DRAFT_843138 [Zopfochytrium polystomum]|nr:hypothetical protein DFJ73DRAFT_843138 [Zopfochytrium polystomum]
MPSARGLDVLPVDVLQTLATDYLPRASDRAALSALSANIRAILAPTVFRAIRISNRPEDADAIAAVTAAYGQHAHYLSLDCFLFENPPPEIGDRPADHIDYVAPLTFQPAEISQLSETAAALLRGDTLPQVRSFRIRFVPKDDFDGTRWVDDEYGQGGSIYISICEEDYISAAAAEAKFQWRSVLSAVWRALSVNHRVTRLDVRELPPNISTAWRGEAWLAFVSRLEHLSLHVWGSQSGNGFGSNTTPGYSSFVGSQLRAAFFDLARNLRSLEFIVSADSPDPSASRLSATNMPQLRDLALHNFFINRKLVGFVRAHRHLVRIRLVDCLAFSERPRMSWAHFFASLADSDLPPRLAELSVETTRRVPLVPNEQFFSGPVFIPSPDEPHAVRRVRARLEADPKFRLFPYTYLDSPYGIVFADENVNLRRAKAGNDIAAYWRLVETVKRNAAAGVGAEKINLSAS